MNGICNGTIFWVSAPWGPGEGPKGQISLNLKSIPNYFNNSETPIICYKYNKPIRSTIFNFNKIVNDLDIDSNTPAS